MMNVFKKHNKFQQAQLWIEQAQVREDKKQAIQPVVSSQEIVQDQQSIFVQQTNTVFTKEDRGHDEQETQKIQTIYKELEDVIRFPVISFT